MVILILYVETTKIIQYQMYQISLENANTSEITVISSLSIKLSFICWVYIMEEVIKDVYGSNFATAYGTYQDAVKKIL